MDRAEKAATIEEIAAQIEGSEAIFAVDYRGISVSQAAELRGKLGEADASFRVVKNRLTKLAAEKAGEDRLAEFLDGPTALTFVRGDTAQAAKAISTFNREKEVLTFKGGFMDGLTLDEDKFQSIARLPTRPVLHGQLAGMVASPLTGLVRGLGSMIQGLALQLGQIAEQGLVSGEAPSDSPAGPVAEDGPPAHPPEDASSAPPAEESKEMPEGESQAADPGEGAEGEPAETDQGAEEPGEQGAGQPAEAQDTSEEASSSDSWPPIEEATETEQAEPDPPAPGREAEEAGGTEGKASKTSNENEEDDQ